MNLIIDLGNTQAKVAEFDKDEIIRFEYYQNLDLQKIKSDFTIQNYRGVLLSSVINHDPELEELVRSVPCGHVLSESSRLPYSNKYDSKATLGNDRRANAAALHACYSGSNALCVDLGTCIKYDFVDKKGNYLGGSISPGFGMRFKALNTFTDKLPLIELQPTQDLIGTDTKDSIVTGVFGGVVAEINEKIMRYQSKYKGVKVVMTGGDTSFFENEVKSSIFADAFFTLRGLNAILKVNAD